MLIPSTKTVKCSISSRILAFNSQFKTAIVRIIHALCNPSCCVQCHSKSWKVVQARQATSLMTVTLLTAAKHYSSKHLLTLLPPAHGRLGSKLLLLPVHSTHMWSHVRLAVLPAGCCTAAGR